MNSGIQKLATFVGFHIVHGYGVGGVAGALAALTPPVAIGAAIVAGVVIYKAIKNN